MSDRELFTWLCNQDNLDDDISQGLK